MAKALRSGFAHFGPFAAAVLLPLFGWLIGCAKSPPYGTPSLATGGMGSAGHGLGGGGTAGTNGGGTAGTSEPELACLAPFIARRCGTAGCHDAITKNRGMDLSTPASIYASWVNRNGLDYCGNMLVPRVVPGDPAASFVMRKVTGDLSCFNDQSQRMPPTAPLEASEIEMLRGWIAAGAPKVCSPAGFGGAPGGGFGGSPGSGGSVDDYSCSATQACKDMRICEGDNCSTQPWNCITHYDPLNEHPCPTELAPYCGCDGVTFEAAVTCPDRPYQHPGRCGDGYNCHASDAVCGTPPPVCAEGETPSIVKDCFGACVPIASCRCEFYWECPDGYDCNRDEWRCVPRAPLDGGT